MNNFIYISIALLIIGFILYCFIIIKKNRYISDSNEIANNKASEKGTIGENSLYYYLLGSFPDNRIFRNLYLFDNNSNSVEIDSVLINEYGIFVFEYKNYECSIYGTFSEPYWTAHYGSDENHKLYSPVFQNRKHVRILKENLNERDLTGIPIYSVTVFANKAKFKTDIRSTKHNEYILKLSELESFFSSFDNAPIMLSDDQIELCIILLDNFTIVSEEEKEEHINRIKERFNNDQ